MIREFKGVSPIVNENSFIAETAVVIGNVELKKNSNIWYGAVLRGDVNNITVGENSNIQDNSVVHCDRGFSTVIEDNVTIGHGAIIHGCHIKSNSLIGMGAIVLNGAVIGSNVIVGAGALVPPGKIIPDNSLVVGSPAKVIREVSEEERAHFIDSAMHYVQLSKEY